MQAVARIHRMNQLRETQVVRFVMDDTVEAALHSLTSAKAAKMDMSSSAVSKDKDREAPLSLSDVAVLLFDSQHVHADS
jgi:SNF2 family DNA or RNA helicase